MYLFVKNILQRLIALLLLIVMFPLLLVISCALWIALRGNPFFFQQRPGLLGKPFHLIKFRSMTNETDSSGELLSDSQRTPMLGRFIRKASIDELPQLINVAMGDMALIGPRPLLMQYLPLYSDYQMKRHNVLPGITGWAQVNGRNALSWSEKFKFDVYYVDNQCLMLDLKIILKTFKKVFVAEGVNASEKVTMEPFNGNN